MSIRLSFMLPVAAAIAATIGWSSPAAATHLAEASYLCNQNPYCVQSRRSSGVVFRAGSSEVYCPYRGECVCIACWGSLAQSLTSSGYGARPASVIVFSLNLGRGTKNRPPRPGTPPSPQPAPTPPTAEPKSPPIVPNRTVRDHRGPNGFPGKPTVTDTRYPYDIGKDDPRKGPSKERTPDIRDHRNTASDQRKPDVRDHRGAGTPPKSSNSGRPSGASGVPCSVAGAPDCPTR